MLNLLSLTSINNVYFRIVSLQFGNYTRTYSFLNFLFLKINGNFLLSKSFYHFHQIYKVKSTNFYRINEIARKIKAKDCCSEMSFCISADSSGHAETDSSLTPVQMVKLKVMNYNVLSQALLEQHVRLYSKQKRFMLQWHYRRDLLLQEILTVNPDILCLQEVEEAELPHFFKHLENYGYKSVSKMKTRQKGDGLSLYYRSSDIKLVESDSVEFRQPGIIELETRDNVGLIARLRKGGKEFIVATTHLLYNPRRTEVRLAQVQMLLAELHRMARKDEDDPVGVLLMGDFNSVPDSPVINFIIDGNLSSHYRPLPLCLGISPQCTHMEKESKLFHSEKQNIPPAEGRAESISPSSSSSVVAQSFKISHTFNFSSVYNLSESPLRGITTFQDEWVMVDYIFYTNGLEVLSRLSLPTSADCQEYIHYLPNSVNPSDHLPLVAEFEIL